MEACPVFDRDLLSTSGDNPEYNSPESGGEGTVRSDTFSCYGFRET